MGRPKKPKTQLALTHKTGSAIVSKRPDDLAPKITKASTIEPPESLRSEYSKTQWVAVVNQLVATELVSLADLSTLEQAFIMLDEFDEVKKTIDIFRINEPDQTTESAIKKIFQLNSTLIKLSNAYNSIMYRFGITPIERTKIQFKDSTEDVNPIEALLSGD